MATPGLNATETFARQMKLKIAGTKDLDNYWEAVVDVLRHEPQVLEFASYPDIYVLVKKGIYQLWMCSDQNGLWAVMITEIRQYPRKNVLNIISAAAVPGSDALEFLTFRELVEQWALSENVSLSQIPCAREGWARVLRSHGYEQVGVVLQKKLEPVKEQ